LGNIPKIVEKNISAIAPHIDFIKIGLLSNSSW